MIEQNDLITSLACHLVENWRCSRAVNCQLKQLTYSRRRRL